MSMTQISPYYTPNQPGFFFFRNWIRQGGEEKWKRQLVLCLEDFPVGEKPTDLQSADAGGSFHKC